MNEKKRLGENCTNEIKEFIVQFFSPKIGCIPALKIFKFFSCELELDSKIRICKNWHMMTAPKKNIFSKKKLYFTYKKSYFQNEELVNTGKKTKKKAFSGRHSYLLYHHYDIYSHFKITDEKNVVTSAEIIIGEQHKIPFTKYGKYWKIDVFKPPFSPLFMCFINFQDVEISVASVSSDFQCSFFQHNIFSKGISTVDATTFAAENYGFVTENRSNFISHHDKNKYAIYSCGKFLGIYEKNSFKKIDFSAIANKLKTGTV